MTTRRILPRQPTGAVRSESSQGNRGGGEDCTPCARSRRLHHSSHVSRLLSAPGGLVPTQRHGVKCSSWARKSLGHSGSCCVRAASRRGSTSVGNHQVMRNRSQTRSPLVVKASVAAEECQCIWLGVCSRSREMLPWNIAGGRTDRTVAPLSVTVCMLPCCIPKSRAQAATAWPCRNGRKGFCE